MHFFTFNAEIRFAIFTNFFIWPMPQIVFATPPMDWYLLRLVNGILNYFFRFVAAGTLKRFRCSVGIWLSKRFPAQFLIEYNFNEALMCDDGNWFCQLFDGGKFGGATWWAFVAVYCRTILFDFISYHHRVTDKNDLITPTLPSKDD